MARIVPPVSWRSPSKEVTASDRYAAPYLSTDQGRVLLRFNAHGESTSKASSGEGTDVPPAEIAPPAPDASIGVPASMLSSYAGIYLSHDPSVQEVRVGTPGVRLELDVAAQFRNPPPPLPN